MANQFIKGVGAKALTPENIRAAIIDYAEKAEEPWLSIDITKHIAEQFGVDVYTIGGKVRYQTYTFVKKGKLERVSMETYPKYRLPLPQNNKQPTV